MGKFEFETEFKIEKIQLKDVKDFIGTDTTSPYLEEARKKRNTTKPITNAFGETEKPAKQNNSSNAFAQYEKKGESEDFNDLSEQKLNDSLDELSSEDYQEFAGLGVELIDFGIDKAFMFMDREGVANTKEQDKKKERLKIIVGKLFQKWGVKFSLEFLAVIMLIGYGSSKWNKAIPKEKKKKEAKVLPMIKSKASTVKKDKEEVKSEVINHPKKEKARGLIQLQSNG